MKFSFTSPTKLYLVLDYIAGGELFFHLQNEVRFSAERVRFYVAELSLALGYLHGLDIVYRDLKPENILLASSCALGLRHGGRPAGRRLWLCTNS